ncbi:MAG: hypothetical protein ACOZCO_13570 [Bacteroidota bacterium]
MINSFINRWPVYFAGVATIIFLLYWDYLYGSIGAVIIIAVFLLTIIKEEIQENILIIKQFNVVRSYLFIQKINLDEIIIIREIESDTVEYGVGSYNSASYFNLIYIPITFFYLFYGQKYPVELKFKPGVFEKDSVIIDLSDETYKKIRSIILLRNKNS